MPVTLVLHEDILVTLVLRTKRQNPRYQRYLSITQDISIILLDFSKPFISASSLNQAFLFQKIEHCTHPEKRLLSLESQYKCKESTNAKCKEITNAKCKEITNAKCKESTNAK